MTEKWNRETKTTENLTFTVHYADGTSAEIDRGVLFSIGDDDTMDIHIGISKAWELFGVARCLSEYITKNGLGDLFRLYCEEDFGDD